MLYIRVYKAIYLIVIILNFAILLKQGAVFGNLQYLINIITILLNSTTFVWINKKIFTDIEMLLSSIRILIILLISAIYPLALLIHLIPTSYVLWLPVLELNKTMFGEAMLIVWVVCAMLFILEMLFFRKLLFIRKRHQGKIGTATMKI